MRKIVITGPTASGKTKTAINLAKLINAEIISSDSMQIYKTMDIGTAKPTYEEQEAIPHHLIDIALPGTDFNAFEYVKLAEKAIAEIKNKNKNVIITGGTGLYLRALTEGLLKDSEEESLIRQELEEKVNESGIAPIREELKTADREKYLLIPENDHRRIIRALSFFKANGTPLSKAQTQWKEKKTSEYIFFGLHIDRALLYKRINERVERMFAAGLIKEVENLVQDKIPFSSSCWQAIGYRQTLKFLDNEISMEELIELVKRDSRRYAKRQLTWFRRADSIKWIEAGESAADMIYSSLKENKQI